MQTQSQMNKLNVTIQEVVNTLSSESYVGMYGGFTHNGTPKRGEWVITGPGIGPLMWRVGYVCQIRLKRGQFGSDMYLIRHGDGTLIAHENNSYIPMDDETIERLIPLFKCLPHDEENDNPDCVYKDAAKIEERGFIISCSASEPTPNTPFTITISDENGSIKSQHKFI